MLSEVLVSATDLVQWANTRDAQDTLPAVLRRLVHATVSGLRCCQFAAGDGVHLSGCDGVVETDVGNVFVPCGRSIWEVGVGKSPSTKADQDYAKRTKREAVDTRLRCTFVFVTPRRWSGKRTWAERRMAEGMWQGVHAYDADDLEGWLETAPAVHVWLSCLLGKHPKGVSDLGTFWEDWAAATHPPMPPEIVLAGRQGIVNRIGEWLATRGSPLELTGESPREALVVFAAAVQRLEADVRDAATSRTIIVHDSAAWRECATRPPQLVLVPSYACSPDEIGHASRHGHGIVVPLGRASAAAPGVLDIPRLDADVVTAELVRCRVPESDAEEKGRVAWRSMATLHRQLAKVRSLAVPPWARDEPAHLMVPALLAGCWTRECEGDRRAMAVLAGRTYGQVEDELRKWVDTADPPVCRVGSTWYLTSPEDAWTLLRQFVTPERWDRFAEVAIDVLQRVDPRFDMRDDQRWMAGALGPTPPYSKPLRQGIARSLAIVGAMADDARGTDGGWQAMSVAGLVRRIMSVSDWRVWASLPLEPLAEAAPGEFLSAVERDVCGPQPVLAGLFRDSDGSGHGDAVHIGLQGALERLAWSRDYLARSALALARLARIDPGGTWSNRPRESLRTILLLWCRQSAGTVAERMAVLDRIRQQEPDVAWGLLIALVARRGGTVMATDRPRWRRWADSAGAAFSPSDVQTGVVALVKRLVEDAGGAASRWCDVAGVLCRLPRDQFGIVLDRLESVHTDEMSDDDRASLSSALREAIGWCRMRTPAGSAPLEGDVARLERVLRQAVPTDLVARHAWLFDDYIPRGGRSAEGWDEEQRRLAVLRSATVDELWKAYGDTWIARLVDRCQRPELVGDAVGRCANSQALTSATLRLGVTSSDPKRRRCLKGFVEASVRDRGTEWAQGLLTAASAEWTVSERAALCTCLPFRSDTWAIIDNMDVETAAGYWNTAQPSYTSAGDAEVAARRFLEHARPSAAAAVLRPHVHEKCVRASIVAEALEGVATTGGDGLQAIEYRDHLADMLAYVSADEELDVMRRARLEWLFLPVLRHREHRPSVLLRQMARSPELFSEMLTLAYRAEGEKSAELPDEERERATRAYELLHLWRGHPVPGTPDGGVVDASALRAWVLAARRILRAAGRASACDSVIGGLLSETQEDGRTEWPHPAVRELVEELASEDFEMGLGIGLVNSGGATFQSLKNGGAPERERARELERQAQEAAVRWPRTAELLRRMAKDYDYYARSVDERMLARRELAW